MTPSIVSQVHALVHLDGIKITNRTNQILFDSAWTAGADCNEGEFKDKTYEKESEDKNEDEENDENEQYDEIKPIQLEEMTQMS